MSGKKFYSQIDMRVKPTLDEHVVRLADMIGYVSGKIKNPVRVVLSANFVGTYANKVLTQTTPAEIVIDGVTLALADRVLLIGQTDKTQNGIYTVTTLGVTSGAAGVCTWFNLLTSESFEALELTVDQHEKIAEMIETDPYVLVDGKFAEASSLDERLNALYAKYTEK